ncbi:helix-turn-helix transcriptional regulator [Nocardiopsis sp. NPDC006832]|uniref:helix-turn-helix domain-containing protein n=1 Tax=Nocardiopsis sp. NPDC006832 TaxID=3157188 RepID=UPI0033DC652E
MVDSEKAALKTELVQFGQELHRLRKAADISQRELAARTLISYQMLGAIERAERAPRKQFVELADRELGAQGALIRLRPGERESYHRWFRRYVDLEREAKLIHDFQADAIPGLFQIEGYARTVLSAGWPPIDTKQIEAELTARMTRQSVLERGSALLISAIIDESVLRRSVGSKQIMQDQMEHLIRLSQDMKIRIQVLPFCAGAHAAMNGSFKVLAMNDGARLAYAEIPSSGRVISDVEDVEQYSLWFGALQSQALSPSESVDFISRYKEAHSREIDSF